MANFRVVEIEDLEDARREIRRVGADEPGIRIMAPKAVFRVIKIEKVRTVAANLIKQEMLSKGGECAIVRGAANFSVDESDVLLMGTLEQYRRLISKLKMQAFGLPALAEELQRVLNNMEKRPSYILDCRGYRLPIGQRTLVMGILNVTPDSFSDGGKFFDPGRAVEHAHRMVEEGADIIDVGAESTRPGHTPVPAEEEQARLLPVLRRLVRELKVPISVDTYKASTARLALEEGAHIINDQWSFRADPEMAAVCAKYGVPVVLMHNRHDTNYRNLMEEILAFLAESIRIGVEAGISREKIIVDPGIGLGKTYEQNLEVLKSLKELKTLGQPILLGTSRKSVIGKTLDLPVDERMEGTAATVALGIASGVDIVRVHDVKEMVRVARMSDAIVRYRRQDEEE
ncbi:MAG: dihydropteroate synthase [Eubacteriales bacterium]|nr:dihydropteroate synthase [Eubacteriales bacterium]